MTRDATWRRLVLMAGILVLSVSLTAALALAGGNPFAGDSDAVAQGAEIYDEYCSECHGDGRGGSGPNLIDARWTYGGSDKEVFDSVANGRPGGMPSWSGSLSDEEIWKVISYVRSLAK